jgi:hypothetical protein
MKITTPDGELELYIFETDYFADPVRTVSFIVLNLDHAGYDLMGTCVDLKAAGFEVTLIADGLEERGVDVSALRRT